MSTSFVFLRDRTVVASSVLLGCFVCTQQGTVPDGISGRGHPGGLGMTCASYRLCLWSQICSLENLEDFVIFPPCKDIIYFRNCIMSVMQAVSFQQLCKVYYRKKKSGFLYVKFRLQVAQNRSHNWSVLMKRGFNKSCILFITGARQSRAALTNTHTCFHKEVRFPPCIQFWEIVIKCTDCVADEISTDLLSWSMLVFCLVLFFLEYL